MQIQKAIKHNWINFLDFFQPKLVSSYIFLEKTMTPMETPQSVKDSHLLRDVIIMIRVFFFQAIELQSYCKAST